MIPLVLPSMRIGLDTMRTNPVRHRLRQLNHGTVIFKILMGSFAAVSLAVGAIGIMNVLASVAERTREISVGKAGGARVGLAWAMAATAVMRAQTGAIVYAGLSWKTLAVGMGTAAAVGPIFGAYLALKAARLSPIDAMRYE